MRGEQLADYLGHALKDARTRAGVSQRFAADRSGLAQSLWSNLERGRGSSVSLRVWVRATGTVDADLRAYLERSSAAMLPRDAVHLKHQELVARTAARGGWTPIPEVGLGGAGFADLTLSRPEARCLIEVWNWLADVGGAFRSWDRKLERLRNVDGPLMVSGCWVVRATVRNRQLVVAHRTLFAARFPGSGADWLRALTQQSRTMPSDAALLWVSVRGDRLFPARLGSPPR